MFLSFEIFANGWNEQFNTNLGKIQYYFDFILIFFINRDKIEKTKKRVPYGSQTWPDPEKPMPDWNQWPWFTQNQVLNLLHS